MSKDYVISRIKDAAVALIPQGGRAILYGSRARGDARPDSDWDILVLLDKERITLEDMDNITYPIRELGWNLNEMINPIMFTEKEWKAKSFTPFYKNVTKEGITL
ncbi:MAG: nucleotidyltransferase domain-containing protein [Prevotella sp.]